MRAQYARQEAVGTTALFDNTTDENTLTEKTNDYVNQLIERSSRLLKHPIPGTACKEGSSNQRV